MCKHTAIYHSHRLSYRDTVQFAQDLVQYLRQWLTEITLPLHIALYSIIIMVVTN